MKESVKPFSLSEKAAGHSRPESLSNTYLSFIRFKGITPAIMDG